MSDRIYYRIEPDSPVMVVIREAEVKQRAFSRAAEAFGKEFPDAKIWTANNRAVIGVSFPGPVPPGWRQGKRQYAVPDKRMKAGREIAARLDALPKGVDPLQFGGMLSQALGGDYTYWGEGEVLFTVYRRYGECYVLSVPIKCELTPPGCAALKMSEYWQIRETEERNRGAA